jgi:hypothetical protein
MKELLDKKRTEKEAFQDEFAAFESQIALMEKGIADDASDSVVFYLFFVFSSIIRRLFCFSREFIHFTHVPEIDQEDTEHETSLQALRDELDELMEQAAEAEGVRDALIQDNADRRER